MNDNVFYRVVIINFITALIITLVGCYFLKTLHLMDVMYIANIFGLYFIVVYCIDILVQAGNIQNNYQRFIYAAAFIIIFDLLFMFIVPLLFGNVFASSDYLILVFDGARLDLTLNTPVYLAIFGILMLIFNFLLYLKDRKKVVE